MAQQLTVDDARQSLNSHVEAKGAEIRAKYGPEIGWKELQGILADPTCVRYPCRVVFDRTPLEPGEFALPVARGEQPEEGFDIHVHPFFMSDLDRVPPLVLYQLVVVNYGGFAGPDDAEAFGSAVLGISREDYYRGVCEAADQVG